MGGGQLTETIPSPTTTSRRTHSTISSQTILCTLFFTLSRFHNTLFLKLMRAAFDNSNTHVRSHHDFNGVKLHENSLFLYRSPHGGDSVLRARSIDYLILFMFGGWLAGVNSILLLPLGVTCLYLVHCCSLSLLASQAFNDALLHLPCGIAAPQ